MNRSFIATIVLLTAPGTAPAASAQDNWRSWTLGERARLELSAYYVTVDSEIGLKDYEFGSINVDPDNLLGFDDNDIVPLLEAYWRIAKRHTLSYRHLSWNQKSSQKVTALGFEITTLKAELDSQQDILSYSYSLLFDESRDFYAGLGISLVDIEASLRDTEEFLKPGGFGGSAPIPSFLIGYDWAISDRWIWRTSANVLALSLSLDDDVDYSGTVFAVRTGIEWRVLRNMSLTAGLEYDYFDVEADEKGESYTLTYKDEYFGPRVGIALQF